MTEQIDPSYRSFRKRSATIRVVAEESGLHIKTEICEKGQ